VTTNDERPLRQEEREIEPLDPELSLGELFARLGDDIGQLVSTQMELARQELKTEVKEAGRTAGLLGAGSFLGGLSLTLFCFAAAWGLSEVVPEGVGFLIVAVVVGAVAAVLMVMGRQKLEDVKDVAPETRQSLKEDVQWTRHQVT
jgi:hypothetical protein